MKRQAKAKRAVLKKTVKIGKRRYKKAKPAELFLATLYCCTYERDEDGECVDDTMKVEREAQLYTLKELLKLIKSETGLSDYGVNSSDAYFDSDYHDHYDNTESKWTVSVQANPRALERLESVLEAMKKQDRAKREQHEEQWRAKREEARLAPRKHLQVLEGGNAFCSRPSRASLQLVSA